MIEKKVLLNEKVQSTLDCAHRETEETYIP